LSRHVGVPMSVLDYSEHSMQRGSCLGNSYVDGISSGKLFGAGINTNIVAASLEAVVSSRNRIISRKAG
jgi:2-isopropylmalate synthase